jgi:hypothetical protein
MASSNAAIKIAETKKKINRVVNKKFSRTQIVEKPFFLDENSMEKFEKRFLAVLKVLIGLIYIPFVLVAGIAEAIEIGFLAGMKKVVLMYGEFLK